MIYKLKDIVQKTDGLLRGPFGSALKKSIFVPKGINTYKVYEQSVPLQQDENLGNYYISEEYFISNMKRFNVRARDFLVSCSGINYGAIIQLSSNAEQGVINQALLRIRLNNEIVDDAYFLYLFRGLIFRKIISGTGDSTIPNFPPMEVVKNIEFDLPNIEIQRKIGSVLKDIDAKIFNNKAICSDLEAIAKLLYDYWFVQFDFPDENGKPYKSSGGKMVWNDELKREIPVGWEVKYVSDLMKVKTGKEDANFATKHGKYAYFTCSQDVLKCDVSAFEGRAVLLAGNGDFNVKHYTGQFNAYQRTYVLIPEDVRFYALLYIVVKEAVVRLTKRSAGSIVKFITLGDVESISLLNPKDDKLLITLNTIIDKIEQMKNENQQLASLRDFLLPMLMNGQVKVGKVGA